jgi:invasion protein IalB
MSKRHFIAAFAVFLPGFLLALLLTGPAAAQAIERLSNHRDWSAFRYKEDGENVCYMASSPKKAEGDYTQRGDVFAIVTHRPASNRIGEISINAGYTYKKDSSVRLKIGSKNWDLFTDGSSAWAPSAQDDKAIVKAMRAGSSMVVKGTSSRGTLTTDTYSLLGFSKALGAIDKACGL